MTCWMKWVTEILLMVSDFRLRCWISVIKFQMNENKRAWLMDLFCIKKVIWIVLWLHFSHHVRDSKNSLSMSQTGPLDRLCQISLSFSKKLLISTSEDLHDCTKEISMVLILSLKRHLTITRKPHNPISSSMVLVMLQYTR